MQRTYRVIQSFLGFKKGDILVSKKKKGKEEWFCRKKGDTYNYYKDVDCAGNIYSKMALCARCIPENALYRDYLGNVKRVYEKT